MPISSFFIHPSAFKACLWFLAKNKNADAKRGFRDRRKQSLFRGNSAIARMAA